MLLMAGGSYIPPPIEQIPSHALVKFKRDFGSVLMMLLFRAGPLWCRILSLPAMLCKAAPSSKEKEK